MRLPQPSDQRVNSGFRAPQGVKAPFPENNDLKRRKNIITPHNRLPTISNGNSFQPLWKQFHQGVEEEVGAENKKTVADTVDWTRFLEDEIKSFGGKGIYLGEHKGDATSLSPLYKVVSELYEKRSHLRQSTSSFSQLRETKTSQPRYMEVYWKREVPILTVFDAVISGGFLWGTWACRQLFGLGLSIQLMLPDEAYSPQRAWLEPIKYGRLLIKYMEIIEKTYKLSFGSFRVLSKACFFPPLFIFMAQRRLNKLADFLGL